MVGTPVAVPTRRETIKGGGALIGGGLLAGCTGGSDGGGANGSSGSNGSGGENATGGDGGVSYEVCMKPNPCTTFERVPETFATYHTAWSEIAFVLTGQEPEGMAYPEFYPTEFYDGLPGIEIDVESVTKIVTEEDVFSKELFYEVSPDVFLIDHNIAKHYGEWDDDDISEIENNIAPLCGSYGMRPWPEYDEGYPFYTLYELLGKASEVFKVEKERFEPLQTVYDDLVNQVQSEAEPRTIGYMNGDPKEKTFYAHVPGQPGYQGEVQRHLNLEDAFRGKYPSGENSFEVDYEAILEADPDIILIKSGMISYDSYGYDTFQDYVADIAADEVGGQLTAVQENRVYAGGPIEHGPVQSLFIHEAVAKQMYPEKFGEFTFETRNSLADIPEEEQMFDRQRVADIINGGV